LTPLIAELLDKALADGTPCLLGSATKNGDPQISPKGSVAVFDPQTLCFWERSSRSSLAHIKENPRVVIYYRNAARAKEMPFAGGAVRFHGRARVVEDAPIREKVWDKTIQAEKDRDPEKKGLAILITVELVEELSGKVAMQA
jgi:hypothetical protein